MQLTEKEIEREMLGQSLFMGKSHHGVLVTSPYLESQLLGKGLSLINILTLIKLIIQFCL